MAASRRRTELRTVSSLRFKIFFAFLALAAVLLLVFNTYPVSMIRRQILQSREAEMRANFATLSAALESSGLIDYETASTAVSILDVGRDNRVIVTDGSGKVIYDNLKSTDVIGRTVLFPEVVEALYGNDVFSCRYGPEAFVYRAACSVMHDGRVIGAVYAYRYDSESAGLLTKTQNDIARISFAATAASLFFITLFTGSLRRRFDKVLEGVNQIGQGNYDYRIDLRSRDELGLIAEEFNQMSEQLTKNEEVRRQFVSDASHELKTPLASIKLLCDSILQARDIKVGEVREFLGDISDEISRLTRISDNLLYLSRMESGAPADGVCDLTHTVMRAAELLRGNAREFDVTISCDLPDEAFVSGSGDVVYRVVFNLMENAVKYNRPGGSVQVSVRVEDEKTVLRVADTGIGIREEELERIFDRFYRVDKARSRETRGTGLGLSIVGQCMEAVGGHVEVTSTYGEGTCFSAWFLNAPEVDEHDGEEGAAR